MTARKKINRNGFFAELADLFWLSAKAAFTDHIITNRRPLVVKDRNGKYATIRNKKFQKVSSILWMVISAVNILLAFGMPFHGTLYGSATVMKYLTQDTEMVDMMSGIIWSLNDGIKEYLIQNTWIGGLLDTLYQYNFVQIVIILGCTVYFFASVGFFGYAISTCKRHLHPPYFNM